MSRAYFLEKLKTRGIHSIYRGGLFGDSQIVAQNIHHQYLEQLASIYQWPNIKDRANRCNERYIDGMAGNEAYACTL